MVYIWFVGELNRPSLILWFKRPSLIPVQMHEEAEEADPSSTNIEKRPRVSMGMGTGNRARVWVWVRVRVIGLGYGYGYGYG